MESEQVLAPEDIFSSSLECLYDHRPITLSSAGSNLVYTIKNDQSITPSFSAITLHTPDTHPANWSLHASSIWVSSAFLADHLADLHINEHVHSYNGKVCILELGAGAGLPSIALASSYEDVLVTTSDYPDKELIQTLTDNVERNGVSDRCQVVAYAWGTDPSILLTRGDGFEVIMAADTIWNPESHSDLVSTFLMTLRRSSTARVYIIAGLHTGRYTVQSFYETVQKMGLEIESATEREVVGMGQRDWNVLHAEGEDERERRKWIIWMSLKWPC